MTTLDASSLPDGPVSLSIDVTDTSLNSASFAGTPASKDTLAPADPSSAAVAMSGANPADIINQASAAAVQVDVVWPMGTDPLDTAFVRLSDGTANADSAPLNVDPGMMVSYSVDASMLSDGPITVTVSTTDASQNTGSFTGMAATKDTMPPATAPTSANVAAGGMNPMDVINSNNEASVQVDVVWPAGADGTETAVVTLTDAAMTSVSSAPQAVNPGMTVSYAVNASTLAEGAVTLSVDVTDVAQNSASFAGTAAVKDVTAPPNPMSAQVAATMSNPASFINLASESAVQVDVVDPGIYDGTETFTVTLSDGTSMVTSMPLTPGNMTPGTLTFGGISATALNETTISVTVNLQDANGNVGTFTGTPALKDVTAPPAPDSGTIAAVMSVNPQDVINSNNASAITVDIMFNAGTAGDESAFVTISDGTSPDVTSAPITPPAGASTQSFAGLDCSMLNDGPVGLTATITDPAGNPSTLGPVALTKDTMAPATPTSITVRDSGSNPVGVINSNNEAGVEVDVAFDAGSLATDTVDVNVTDGAATVNVGSGNAPAGMATTTFGPANGAALADGAVTIQVTLTDANLNAATYSGAATKDTAPPDDPIAAAVADTGQNPPDFINIVTEAAVRVDVMLPATYVATDMVSVSLSDGVLTVSSSPAAAPAGGGTMSFNGLDSSTLSQGPIMVMVSFQDANMNASTFAGTQATKDTVPPAMPTAANAAAGASNPIDVVNIATESSARFDVAWPVTSAATDTFTIRLFDGITARTSSVQPVTPGASTSTFFDTTIFLDTSITVTVDVLDAAQNPATFAGTPATKDTAPPLAPTSANLAAGAGNPMDVINASNENPCQVDVAWPAGSSASDTFVITLSDGVAMVASTSANVTPGATTMTMFDATTLAEGSVSVTVDVTDTAQNPATFTGVAAVKDTVLPAGAMSAQIAAGASNAADVINSFNVGAVDVAVQWTAASGASDTYTVTLSDGTASVVSPSSSVVPSSTTMVTLDASSLADLPISVTVDIADDHQNPAQTVGTAATKDVVAPTAPTSADVAAGASNAMGIINIANEPSVQVDVVWPGGADPLDSAVVILSDGAASVTSAPAAPNPGSTVSYTLSAASLADGPVAVSVEVTDAAGNLTPFSGTLATKDVKAPDAPISAQVPAGLSNPANTVNAMTETSASLALHYTASSVSTDMVTITVSDGANPSFVLGPIAARQGAGSSIYLGNDLSSLNDGTLTIMVDIVDAAGNMTSSLGTPASKDTVLVNAISAAIPMGPSNPANMINIATSSSVTVDVGFGVAADGSETASVTLFDGSTSVSSAPTAVPSGGGAVSFPGIDTSPLGEGLVSVTVALSDGAGNMNTFVGTPATRDTVAPVSPTSALVAAGGGNPQGIINLSNVASVQVDLSFPATADGQESTVVTLSDGSTSVVSPAMFPPFGGGTVTYTGLDCSTLADGGITITVDATDPAGNTSQLVDASTVKDTTVVASSSTTIPSSASNPADVISLGNQSAVQVDVVFGGSADGSESATVTLTDGAMASVASTSQAIPAGGGSLTFAGLDASTLADGSIDVTVTVSDGSQNSVGTSTLTASKDTVVPALPTAAGVAQTASNPQDFINAATESGVTLALTFPAGSRSDDMATVTLTSGVASLLLNPVAAPQGGGTVMINGVNTGALPEGAVTVSVSMADGGLNSAGPFAGTPATKDVTAPAAPTVDPVTTPTNRPSQDVTGTGDVTTDMVVDGGAAQVVATSDAAGLFTASVPLASSAVNSITVTARDAAGNTSAAVAVDFNAASLDIMQDPAAPDVPFSDATVAFGLGATGPADGGAFADVDNDGDLDLFVASGQAGLLYVYDSGTSTFNEVSALSGGPFAGDTGGVFGDYDNDGDLDLLTVDSTVGTSLYRNEIIGMGTLTFTDVTTAESAGIAGGTLSQVFFLDHDNDGFLDFLVLDGAATGNFLMVNQRGAMSPSNSFQLDNTTGVEGNLAASRLGAVADFDVDGDVDVIFGDTSPGVFYRDDGATYTDIAGVASGVAFNHAAGGHGIVFADYDNDGDFDIFISRGGASNVNQLWRNDGGSLFTEVASFAGIATDVDADDVCFGDVDNDGIIDLYIGSDAGNRLYRGIGDTNMDNVFEFTEIASDIGVQVNDGGNADMVQMADVDGDGDLDLFVGNELAADVLFRNDLDNFDFLKVRVAGQGMGAGTSSRDGRGAVVTLRDDGTNAILATREINGGRGMGGQDAEEVHFGGVTPSRPYKVEVSFPSGTTQIVTVTPRLLAGQTVTVTE